ncbi:MAG: exopolyphosphatase [Gammaproteobacteria bacterium]|nr:exopolyphosphatase [Gammaproteobacteria bacterium]NNL52073.1 exopolyphosphatase [Woeseiaceae bacterium]
MHKPLAAADRPSPSETNQTEIIAAVDLGSNSFHMIVGELRHGQLAVLDRIRETVRLAEGLSPSGDLKDDARERALACLSRFGERLRDMRAGSVRAAGTSTIRRAREDSTFMSEAEAALGHPIEIISGIEEARLIYNGVTHSLPPTDGLRLVMDIGGGSTELILGQAAQPKALESLNMGCVSMTERFFPDGKLSRQAFDKARMAARLELRPVKAFFRNSNTIEAIGTSGTIRSTEAVAQTLGITESGVTTKVVEQLIDEVLAFDSIESLSLPGLSEGRAQVWPGGLSILAELLNVLRIEALQISDGALREGLLYDLLGRLQHEDARERTVVAMASRYHADSEQARRVVHIAAALHSQCASEWGLTSEFDLKVLEWAARLHEIGLDISHENYERHGAYIAEHADMPGFPRAEQRYLAFLIGGQRNNIDANRLKTLPKAWRQTGLRLVMILRLAVLLNRSRSAAEMPPVTLRVTDDSLRIGFDAEWLAANPLTIADLEREQAFLAELGYSLGIDSH